MVVVVVGTMSKRTRSRPWRRYPDPYQPLGTRGDAGSTRWRPRAPTSPYGDGTSPTVPGGAHSRPRWAGGTSSRDKLEVWLPLTGPYPSWDAVGPVGGGSRGARDRSADPLLVSATRVGSAGKGINSADKPPLILYPQSELFYPVQCVQVVSGDVPITVTLTLGVWILVPTMISR